MNDLSWFLYWAEVLPNIGNAIIIPSVILLLVVVSVAVVFLAERIVQGGEVDWENKKGIKYCFITSIFCLFFIVLVQFIPSKQTIYMIAASEVGETVVTSPEAKDMFNDLRAIIKGYTLKEGKDESP